MINLSFIPNEQRPDKNGNHPISMVITFNGMRIRKFIKNANVDLRYWNPKTSRVRKSKDNSDDTYSRINKKLENIQELVSRINRIALRDEITPDREYILDRLENPSLLDINHRDFFESFEEFMKLNRSTKSKNTLKAFRTSFNFIKRFEKTIGRRVSFKSIDLEFF